MSEPANDNRQKAVAARPCPICGRPASPAATPFCSRRCADVDLHRWLGGVYAIPGPAPEEDPDIEPDQF